MVYEEAIWWTPAKQILITDTFKYNMTLYKQQYFTKYANCAIRM